MTTDDDRIAYLAGDGPGALDDTERAELDTLRGMLSDPALWAEVDDRLEDAVVAAIATEAGASASPAAAIGDTASSRRSRWLRPRLLVGAAAAVAIVAAAATVSLDDRSPSQSLVVALEPTELAPGARGDATMARTDSGWRIELDASGLPRLDGGRFYQAWLESDDGVRVAIGSFNEGDDVVLWAGVSPVDHPTITITEESVDGDPASSGREVLVGAVADP